MSTINEKEKETEDLFILLFTENVYVFHPFISAWFFLVRNGCSIRDICGRGLYCKAVQLFPEWFWSIERSHPVLSGREAPCLRVLRSSLHMAYVYKSLYCCYYCLLKCVLLLSDMLLLSMTRASNGDRTLYRIGPLVCFCAPIKQLWFFKTIVVSVAGISILQPTWIEVTDFIGRMVGLMGHKIMATAEH